MIAFVWQVGCYAHQYWTQERQTMKEPSKILLVDDEERMLHLISLMLIEFGWSVSATSQPEEALRMVREERYRIAFIDNQLGPMEGITLIEKIREIDADLPCVLMSGYLNIDRTTEALKKGTASFLRKPFRVEDLLVSIEQGNKTRELLEHQRALTELQRKRRRKRPNWEDA